MRTSALGDHVISIAGGKDDGLGKQCADLGLGRSARSLGWSLNTSSRPAAMSRAQRMKAARCPAGNVSRQSEVAART